MSNACSSGLSSEAFPSAALIPPSAAPEWLRTGWIFERSATSAPRSLASIAARIPAHPALTTKTSCVASTLRVQVTSRCHTSPMHHLACPRSYRTEAASCLVTAESSKLTADPRRHVPGREQDVCARRQRRSRKEVRTRSGSRRTSQVRRSEKRGRPAGSSTRRSQAHFSSPTPRLLAVNCGTAPGGRITCVETRPVRPRRRWMT